MKKEQERERETAREGEEQGEIEGETEGGSKKDVEKTRGGRDKDDGARAREKETKETRL